MTDAEIITGIERLRQKRNAVILAHNYELGEIQEIADFCGDSLELSIRAAETDAEVIVFCGVRFMAETAKILSPAKTVLLPVATAGCDMADMADGAALAEFKRQYPGAITVCYVNTTAEVKAECDIAVTSSNALDIIAMLPADRPIIFVPDRNLGAYCMAKTGRKLILWDGYCPVHQRLTPAMVGRRRREYPEAELLMHPEAPPEVAVLADHLLSTGGILRHVREADRTSFIIGTEVGILHRLEAENPNKKLIPLSEQAVCPHMKVIRLADVLRSLEKNETVIEVPEPLRTRAERCIRRMLKPEPFWH